MVIKRDVNRMDDLISRQAAIDAICNACGKIDRDKMDKCEKLQLPPANCSEFPNNSDTISRQAAIDALDKRFDSIPMEQTTEILQLRKDLRELPSAQSEIMDMRIEQAKCKKAELNKSILVKLMLLEYIKPSIFSKFAELNYENKLQDELSILESDDATRSEVFADRLKDDWFIKWLNISPKLFEESLGKYFYVADTLRKIGIDYQGQSVNEVFSRLVDVFSENSNTKDDGVARRAVQEALVGVYDYVEKNDMDISCLDKMPVELMNSALKNFMTEYIWATVLKDLESRIEDKMVDVASAKQREEEIKGVIESVVAIEFGEGKNIINKNVRNADKELTKQCYEVLEGTI